MDKLRRQHKSIIFSIFASLAAWYYYGYYHFNMSSNPRFGLLALLGLSPAGIAACAVFIYEKAGWRLLNPSLDFDGQWGYVEAQFALNPQTNEFVPVYDAWGRLTIKQDVSSIQVLEGETFRGDGAAKQHLSTWHSVACDLDSQGARLFAALDHQHDPSRTDGGCKYGLEAFSATNWTKAMFGKRPVGMSSEVFHCVDRAVIPHRVSVRYVRLSRGTEDQALSSHTIQRLIDEQPRRAT